MVTLESSKLFSQLPAAELEILRHAAQELSFASGQQIFKEGDPGDGVYVVKSGLVQISAMLENGQSQPFSEVVPGDMFGEMAVLDNQPRSASATAEKATAVYFVPRREMVNLLKRSPELSLLLVQEISRRLREFNRKYVSKLLQAERLALVGRFASSIVHDLKNPLTLISLSAEVVCAGEATAETRKISQERISKQVDRITNMVNDILEFTRGGGPKLVLAEINYAQFVTTVIEDVRGEIVSKAVTIEYENPPPIVKIPLNPRRLSRLFHNLLGNAVDAMPAGGKIKLRFHLTEREVITEIEDTGPGIAPEVIDHVFEAFVTFGKPRGTGLGLSIAQKLVEEHGGKITARNQPNRGALFSFSLPRPTPPK